MTRTYKYQQGAATLLITSILLSVALVVTLGSYKNLFYQIKRAQNEVNARQQHWEAEGGLECLFAYVKDDVSNIAGVVPINHGKLNALCKNTLNLSQLNVTDLSAGLYRINSISHNGWTQLNKTFSTLSNRGKGVIQTTSKLTTYGDLEVHPDADGDLNADGEYECVSMTYKYSYTMKGSNPTSNYTTKPVSANSLYQGSPAGGCTAATTTSVSVNPGDSVTKTNKPETSDPDLKGDFVYDDKVDPFHTFFDYKKTPENIAKVKASFPSAGKIDITDIAGAKNCKESIENAFKNVDKVWVTGNCILTGALALSSGTGKNYTLVIQDGMFANFGSTTFEGSIFHLVDKSKAQFTAENINKFWDSLFYEKVDMGNDVTSKKPTTLQAAEQYITQGETVYADVGAFNAVGGYGFDSDGLGVSIAASMKLQFDSRKRPTTGLNDIQWQEGSWNAQ